MKDFIIVATLLLTPLTYTSCNKNPGEGGTSSISGKLFIYDLDAPGLDTLDAYYAMDEDVFIIYGEESTTYDDKYATSFEGSYRFDYLTPGKYTIFAYTRCDTCPDQTSIVQKVVDITDKKQEIEVQDIVILK